MKLPRNAQQWLPGWWAARRRVAAHRFDPSAPVTVWLMIGDHHEPYWGRASDTVAASRAADWAERWPRIAEQHLDSFDRPAQWGFFYPQEEYHPEVLDRLTTIVTSGFGDIEVHIHHDGEGEADFVSRISGFVRQLRDRHGLLHDVDGRPGFAFIHGNWALDNSRPDGRWCGLNNELTLLRQLGCYADFTMPSAPDPCQTSLVNAIYWAVDDPTRPKSHDTGTLVTIGGTPPVDGLLCVQGPLTIRRHPRYVVLPSLEVGELAGYAMPNRVRAECWLDSAPRLGNEVFVKLHTHGAPESNAKPLLGGGAATLFSSMRLACEARGWRLAHATPFQFWQAIEATRRGQNAVSAAIGGPAA